MKTKTLERIKARFNRSARKCGLYTYGGLQDAEVADMAYSKSSAYWARNLHDQRQHRAYMAKVDLLTCGIWERIRPTGRLTFSSSLSELLAGMESAEDGVAAALIRASKYSHCHARKVPGNFYAIREKAGLISYLPAGRRLMLTDSGTWARDGRQEMKPAKWARAILAGWQLARLTDQDFAKFAAKFAAAENASALRLELCEDVGDVYERRNFSDHVSGSCMQADADESKDNGRGYRVGPFYKAAGAQVLAIWRGDGRLEARAMYWPEVHIGGRTVPAVDRVYGSPEHCEMIKAWARENGAAVKGNMSGKGSAWELDGQHLGYYGYITPVGDVDGVNFFPYLDTFRYQDSSGNLCAMDDEETVYEYCCTGGGREERDRHEGEVQLHDGTWHDEDDAYEVNGEYYAGEDVVMCHRSDEYILRDGAFEIELGRNNTIYLSAEYVTEL